MELDLIHADAIQALPKIPSESVDVVFTSPDYNLGIKYKSSQKVQKLNDYLTWAATWSREIIRVLKPTGSFFLNVAGAPSRPLLPFNLVSLISDFAVLQNTFHWIKSISIHKEGKTLSVGHFKPLSSERYVNDMHEYVFHFTKNGNAILNRKAIGVEYTDPTNIKRWAHAEGSNVRCRGNTWFCPYKTIQSRNKQRPHPATFPPKLAEMAFRLAGVNSTSTVLDPFVGIGNSGIAAAAIPAGKFIGIDIEKFYVEEAKQRIVI